MRPILALAAACVAGALSAPAAPPPALRVVTLSTVLTEVACEVGGTQADVTGLVQPGVDPHAFSPSPSDLRALVDADVVLASGLHLERYLDRLAAAIGPGGRVLAVGDAVPVVIPMPGAGPGGEKDPHWWHSIDDMLFAVGLVRDQFSSLRPASAGAFARNAHAYSLRLTALKAWVAAQVASIPPARRQLVTSHDAFGYFAGDFGFALHPIAGVSPDSEPDARRLAALVDLIRRERIPALFAESSANPRLVESLLDETGARLGGTLYADGLGPRGSGAETYESMYRSNVGAIVSALSAP